MAYVYEQKVKFGPVRNFKRVEKVSFGKQHYKLYVDKNDSVYEVCSCEVLSWKTIEKGRRKINVPDQIVEKRDVEFFNKVKGNPFKIAATKIIAELEYQQLNNQVQ